MIGARRAAGGVLAALAVVLTGCGSGAATESASSSVLPPPTAGVMPWGADLQGFGDRREVRCDGADEAVRMAWHHDDRFLICRTAGSGERYMRAWTAAGPGKPGGAERAFHEGAFFTLTDTSLQFLTDDDVKFDIGRDTMTIEWPQEPGSRTKRFTTIRTGEGWSRLD